MDDIFLKAKSVDLFHYLASLGYHPIRSNDRAAYYISPKRKEKKASFEVDRVKNRWSDWGESGAFGDVIDFVVWLNGCTTLEAAKILVNEEAIPQYHKPPQEENNQKNIEVLEERDEITNVALIEYLEVRRKIPVEVANKYCSEVLFQFAHSRYVKYYGVGWKNDLGGWGIRGLWFRGATRPAGISTVHFGGTTECLLFEGMLDWLSYVILHEEPEHTAIALNSLIYIPMMLDYLQGLDLVHLWIDNDAAATDKIEYLLANKVDIIDHRDEFAGYKDLNEKLQAEYDV